VCVGLDPVPEKLPDCLKDNSDSIAVFLERIIESTASYTAAYKPNLAFFEALGHEGIEALHRSVAAVRKYAPQAIVIGDGKRNDIGHTAQRYAVAMFDHLDFDAITVNPYLGWDGICPFAEREDRGIFLLALTSNPSAEEVQYYKGEAGQLFLHVARLAQEKWNVYNNLGLVVGATKSDKIALVREVAPDLPFLLPGIGVQGGDLIAVVKLALGEASPPGLINSSRGIIYASREEDFAEAAAKQAELLRNQIESLKE